MANMETRSIAQFVWNGLRRVIGRCGRPLEQLRRYQAVRELAQRQQPLNVMLGAGPVAVSGWVSTDVATLNVASPRAWKRIFVPDSIDRLLAEHLFEHLSDGACGIAFEECFRYLKPGGLLRIAVPDGNRKDAEYVAEVSPPNDGHQQLFTVDDLVQRLVRTGFEVTPLEYYDAREDFHCHPWDEADGLIRRSARHDRQVRFKRGALYYTSLIVDARKPRAQGEGSGDTPSVNSPVGTRGEH